MVLTESPVIDDEGIKCFKRLRISNTKIFKRRINVDKSLQRASENAFYVFVHI